VNDAAATRRLRFHRVTPLLPCAALAALIGVSAARFAVSNAPGEELLAVIPIALLAVMFGARGGLASALFASVVFLIWAAGHHVSALDYVDEPLAFFTLGALTGLYGHGALGDYDLERHRLRRQITHAIARGELVMYYQPVVDVADGQATAVEALVRWETSSGRLRGPTSFIPAAERDPGTIRALTLYTFEAAARYARDHLAPRSMRVAVNLSAAALLDPALIEDLDRILRDAGLPPDHLDIEITETAFAEDADAVVAATNEIKKLGIRTVLLDDFGVGQSSLARLGGLRVDALKIDRRLTCDLARPEYEAVIRSIVELAHGLGMTVVAEGVEDAVTAEELGEIGCDALQGFHLSPPLPASALDSWLEEAASVR
jgi:EAL domain-containing protein (putative c-di-GMP-specific phosphodiesterase class I)